MALSHAGQGMLCSLSTWRNRSALQASHSHPGNPTLACPPSFSPSSPRDLRGTLRQSVLFFFFAAFLSLELTPTKYPSAIQSKLCTSFSKVLYHSFPGWIQAGSLGELDILLPMFHTAVTPHLLPLIVTQPGLSE